VRERANYRTSGPLPGGCPAYLAHSSPLHPSLSPSLSLSLSLSFCVQAGRRVPRANLGYLSPSGGAKPIPPLRTLIAISRVLGSTNGPVSATDT